MDFLSRLKQARMVRILLVYLGASWVVVEVADLLQEELGLPGWVVPVSLILLLAGLVVVAATAWVQGRPDTDRAEAAGEVPRDWQMDLPDLARSLRRGRLPHPNWARAVIGGLVAFLALFGLAALLNPAADGRTAEPEPAESGEAAPALAVLPFRVSGTEVASWSEGLVDLLSRNLDGIAGLRAIDSRTVLARWRETVRGEPDLPTALEAGRRTGASWALVGTVVEVGPVVRVTADLHDLGSGRRMEGVSAEGPPGSLLGLVDAISVDVARLLLERESPELSGLRLASITTESPAALAAFLRGEAAYRRSRFEDALEAYERAIALDSTFALAHSRIGAARGWISLPDGDAAREKAYAHRHRLPRREALLVEAEYRARRGALESGVDLLRHGTQQYPDDPEFWYQLGDVYLHRPGQLDVSPSEAEGALLRAVELAPDFAPYHIHLVDLALIRGDSAESRRRLDRERELVGRGGESLQLRTRQLQFDYLYGGEAARNAALAALDTLDSPFLTRLWSVYSLDGEKAGEALGLGNAACRVALGRDGRSRALTAYACLQNLLMSGAVAEARSWMQRLLDAGWSGSLGPGHPVHILAFVMRQTGLDPTAPRPDSVRFPPGADLSGATVSPDLLMAAVLAAEAGEAAVADSVARRIGAEAEARQAAGDTLRARLFRGFRDGVEGYGALAEGRDDEALRRFEGAADLLVGTPTPEDAFRGFVVWPLAELKARSGRGREAIRLYESLWSTAYGPAALLRRAEQHRLLGEDATAEALRRQFLEQWSEADPAHPLMVDARAGLSPD